jgi:pimeloyl-ACP methyl ester carboxylesterase
MRAPVALALALVAPLALAADDLVTVSTRDTSISYLLVQGASPPRAIAVSFVGGNGMIDLAKRARENRLRFGPGANFLIRARNDLAGDDIVDAIVDAPADHLPGGFSDADRMSADHARDIGTVLDDLGKRFPNVPVFLVGTSRGTISAAALGASISPKLRGVVLTSTVTVADRTGPGLSAFDFATIRTPVLLVHHRDDACRSSPYAGAERLSKRFPLVSVKGGDPPQSGPCDPQSPHGYLGRDADTMRAIRNYILGRDYARDIE